ncbi:N-myc-interactor [Patagioenas fasciata monilis]|uniref:N-myc-interactor n=1 Tax=Patagioenas fasciata monilis TaxID=372326 RepID=A0A1V4K711_PATFA|nr:N-myc-interactor [Patagioenas fasciata monilis]
MKFGKKQKRFWFHMDNFGICESAEGGCDTSGRTEPPPSLRHFGEETESGAGGCWAGTRGCDPALRSWVSMDLTSPPLPLQDNGFSVTTTDSSGTPKDEMGRLKEELEKWKEEVEKAEKAKADLLLCKVSADEECIKAEEKLIQLKNLQEKQHKEMMLSRDTYEREIFALNQGNAELKREMEKLREDLAGCGSVLSPGGQIKKKVAEMKMKFSHTEDMKDDYPDVNTHCVFGVATKIPFRLNQNQALLTFEDEEVAQRLIKMGKHTVNLDSKITDVRVKPFTLEMGIKFELHVTISGKKINVSDVPELPIPEDWMRDKLELNFYKSKQGGGGEVENVSYDRQSGTAVVTFLTPGAANGFVRCTEYPFFVNGRRYRLSVSPNSCAHLEKFQLYCGVSKKTILLKGIPEMEDDEESIQDMIEIHFQKPSNNGGEIEKIKYVSKGVTCVCFEEDT